MDGAMAVVVWAVLHLGGEATPAEGGGLPKDIEELLLARRHPAFAISYEPGTTAVVKLKPGQTSRDHLFSLETVACMGACGLSPVMNLNGEFYAKVTPQKLIKIIQECRETESKNGK